MFNIHAFGGLAMMKRTVTDVTRVCRPAAPASEDPGRVQPQEDLHQVGVAAEAGEQVVRLARLAKRAGLDGVVASPREIAAVRRACGRDFLIVTPGVRPAGADLHDQKRVLTPGAAVAAGADYVVVSRPVLAAADPAAAARDIIEDITRGAAQRRR
jgi:orotidine-5'-phosphate decarboxylase